MEVKGIERATSWLAVSHVENSANGIVTFINRFLRIRCAVSGTFSATEHTTIGKCRNVRNKYKSDHVLVCYTKCLKYTFTNMEAEVLLQNDKKSI